MAWWRKKVVSPARRAWAVVSTRVRARNAGSGGSILKLHEDVQTCGYRDVQVMFDILTSELEASTQRPAVKRQHHQQQQQRSRGRGRGAGSCARVLDDGAGSLISKQ